MKKTFVAALSLCAFLTVSANAQESTTAVAEKKHHKKSEQSSEITAKEKALRSEIEKNSSCKNILNECEKSGFVAGGYKDGNGLWRNCFANVVEGKSATLKGKDVIVATNATDVSSCKAVVKEVRKEKKEMKAAAKKAKAEKAEATIPTAKQ